MRPGSESSRKHWASLVRSAADSATLSEVLLKYVHLLPKTSFRKGFRKWWLADGGVEEAKRAEREAREGGGGKELRGRPKDREDRKEGERREAEPKKESKDSKELPPAQADSAHQVLLRLHLLDAGLAYC